MHGPTELWFSGTGDLLQYMQRVDVYKTITNVVVTNNRTADLLYTVRQIVEGDSLQSLDFSARGCVLHGEKKLKRYPVYGQSACLLECALHEPHTYGKRIGSRFVFREEPDKLHSSL